MIRNLSCRLYGRQLGSSPLVCRSRELIDHQLDGGETLDMTPKDVAGIFSRSFVVGFFLPAFFVLLLLAQCLTTEFLPSIYEQYRDGTRVVILGGTALLAGLLLLGLNYPILRALEGYPLRARRDRWYARWLHDWLVGRHRKRFDNELRTARSGASPELKGQAAWRLDLYFPDTPNALLPTRFGNAVRAFERHSAKRWGLDSIALWPRIELLIGQEERDLAANAHGDAAFFVNLSLLTVVAGVLLIIDGILYGPLSRPWLWAYLIPFIAAYVLYRWSVGAATRWGSVIRAGIDIHRFELYEKLGVRAPTDFTDELDTVGPAVSGTLLYGYPMPNSLRRPERQDTVGAKS